MYKLMHAFVEIGFAFGLLVNAILFIIQAYKLFRVKSSKEISFVTFLGFNIIQVFTGVHAYFSKDIILLLGTLLIFMCSVTVTFLAFYYRNI